MGRRDTNERLFETQGGLSPLTGESLVSRRLENHHVTEACVGGGGEEKNLQRIPIEEHLAEHWRRSKDASLPESRRNQEFHTVMGRLSELTEDELRRFNRLIQDFTGDKLHFY